MPAGIPEIVVLAPVPVVITPPGDLVNVQVPEEGKPLRTASPVDNEQVGWVIAPTTGAGEATGAELITTAVEAAEVHPAAFVTVKL